MRVIESKTIKTIRNVKVKQGGDVIVQWERRNGRKNKAHHEGRTIREKHEAVRRSGYESCRVVMMS